jgi:hypothetical protein
MAKKLPGDMRGRNGIDVALHVVAGAANNKSQAGPTSENEAARLKNVSFYQVYAGLLGSWAGGGGVVEIWYVRLNLPRTSRIPQTAPFAF